ncbi:sulfotransferase domain-containing protein [Phenylobacterium immobile]|uniref:sulfotransferase domain-containing protein n=1 Tax=Phenylobacterium immobile TaxID=21 RepID=UPI000AE8F771|nr:sulfotransferase domain-containing protein [Phenylobacterium immobile]
MSYSPALSANKPLVDFVVAGAQKGGTTALYDYLAEDPAICMARIKETHFFDDDARDWSAPDYEAYHALFAEPSDRLCGEATPIYIYWPCALERIARYNRAMRLIVLLRDPVARAWSHWRMEHFRGVEPLNFSEAIRGGRGRLFAGGRGAPWGYDREFSYVERGFYGDQVERLFAIFPREQTLILRSTALQDEPAETLERVRDFLGAPARPPAGPRQVHVGATEEGLDLDPGDAAFLRELYARDDERLKALTGFSFQS